MEKLIVVKIPESEPESGRKGKGPLEIYVRDICFGIYYINPDIGHLNFCLHADGNIISKPYQIGITPAKNYFLNRRIILAFFVLVGMPVQKMLGQFIAQNGN